MNHQQQGEAGEGETKAGRGGLLASSAVFGGLTLISRVLGLVRDMVFAGLLGASAGTDAFFVAFRIPNFLRRLFGEGAFNQAFVPVLSEYRSQGSRAAVRELIDRVAGTLGATLALVTLVGVAGAPLLIWVFAPGFGDEPAKRALAVDMLRLTFPYLFFIALTAFAGGIFNTWNRFAVPAFTPVLLNLALIAAALCLTPYYADSRQAMALAWGVLAAGLIQLLFQLPFLARLGLLPRPRMVWSDPGVRRILRLMAPALFGVSVTQINLLVDTVLASLLETGSVTWLYYSDRLMELPLGVFAIAIGTVILPHLSRHHAEQSPEAFSHTLDRGLRLVLLVGWPAALALVLVSEPLLATLFHYGAFSRYDVQMAGLSLAAYGCGLPGFMLIKVLAPGYFARQDTKSPVTIGAIAMAANMALSLALVWHLRHAGLALATAASAWINAGLLWRGLYYRGFYRPERGWWRFLVRLALAGAVLALIIVWLAQRTGVWWTGGALARAGEMALLVGGGSGAYFLVLGLAGLRLRHLRR